MRPILEFALLYLFFKNMQARSNPAPIKYVSWLPSPRRAMTIPPFGIYIKDEHKGNEILLAHELCHWEQYKNKGMVPFYVSYFTQFLSYGYKDMPMETNCGPSV